METKLRSIWQRIGWGSSLEQMAVMIVSILIQRLEKSIKFCMDPMPGMTVFHFILWVSAKSIIFSDVAFISLINSRLIRHLFLWGRNTDGSTEFALSSRLKTFSVAKFPWRIWEARALEMTLIKTSSKWMFMLSCCLATSKVILTRSANWLAQAAHGWFNTTCMPFDGGGKEMFDTVVDSMPISPRTISNINLIIPFFASDFLSTFLMGAEAWCSRLERKEREEQVSVGPTGKFLWWHKQWVDNHQIERWSWPQKNRLSGGIPGYSEGFPRF